MFARTKREILNKSKEQGNKGCNLSDGLPRVVVLAKGFPPTSGGVEQYSLQVTRAYLRAGFSVSVLTQTEGGRGWSRNVSVDGAYLMWNAGRGPQPLVFIRMVAEALRLSRSISVLRVHSTTWRVGLVGMFVLRKATNVLTVHGREVLNYPRVLGPWLRRVLIGAHLVMSVSAATESLARAALNNSMPMGAWVVSYNGLSYPDETTVGELASEATTPLRILSLSRLVPRKNIEASLRALSAAQVLGRRDFEFRVAGTGPERSHLEVLTRELGLEDRVTFLGYVMDDQIPGLYGWADVFLHPHTHVGEGRDFEGFGIVIADAMMFGCAVIVGDVGGPRELVDNGVNGLLVDGTDVQGLTDAIVSLMDSQELVAALAAEARVSARNRFSWDSHVLPAVELFNRRQLT